MKASTPRGAFTTLCTKPKDTGSEHQKPTTSPETFAHRCTCVQPGFGRWKCSRRRTEIPFRRKSRHPEIETKAFVARETGLQCLGKQNRRNQNTRKQSH